MHLQQLPHPTVILSPKTGSFTVLNTKLKLLVVGCHIYCTFYLSKFIDNYNTIINVTVHIK